MNNNQIQKSFLPSLLFFPSDGRGRGGRGTSPTIPFAPLWSMCFVHFPVTLLEKTAMKIQNTRLLTYEQTEYGPGRSARAGNQSLPYLEGVSQSAQAPRHATPLVLIRCCLCSAEFVGFQREIRSILIKNGNAVLTRMLILIRRRLLGIEVRYCFRTGDDAVDAPPKKDAHKSAFARTRHV